MKEQNLTLSGKDKIALISNLATMLAAGISILETVDSLLEDSKGNQKKLLEIIHEDLMQGKHINVSFAKFPKIFDKVTVNIIKAAEEAGTLDVSLKDIKSHIQKEMEFMDKVKSAMTYPILIFGVFILVMLMILIFVIPRMASVFTRMKAELPLPTKVLIFISDIVVNNTVALVLGIASIITALILIYKYKRRWILNILFSLPVVSGLVLNIDLTRFTRSMSLLLSSGLTVTNALELTQNVVMRRDVSRLIEHTHNTVLGGKHLAEGLRDGKGLIPMLMIKIIEAGEKTGTLDKSMQDMSEYLDYQVSKSLDALTTLIEPIMLIFIGIIVGGMMLSIIAPIYSIIGQVGGN
ncbi:MAG: type II secretion system F family protein [Weeksellaceae bacterium]